MVLDCDTWPVPVLDTSTPEDFCVNGCVIPGDTDETLLEAASVLAGTILHTLSGRRVGTCFETLRPLSECWTCRGNCCCGGGDRVRVLSSAGPVLDVAEVTVDGDVIDPSGYRYYPSGQLLYRVPPDVWPQRDLKYAGCGDPGTMCVDVVVGNEPDAWATSVHDELTCELLKSCADDDDCKIPSTATQVVGQGISITLTPEQIAKFIPNVARWVAAVNPHNAQQPAMVYSPDLGPHGSGCGCG